MTNPSDRADAESPLGQPVEQRLLRLLWTAARAPDRGVLTGADLAARLAEQGQPIRRQAVIAFLQTLAARHYVRLVLVFDSELEVIVAGVNPSLTDLLEPAPGEGS